MECIKLGKKENCCGCTACFSVCPVNAIIMKKDEEGFLYPEVNKELCVSCGKCSIVCPLTKGVKNSEPIKYLAVKNKDYDSRISSSSGGVFSLLAKYVEEKNGIIYGACFDELFNIRHERASERNQWKKFKGSKYVQSNLKNTFKEVKKDLMDGKYVLYTGTPCHIEGLKKYLRDINHEKLITCDIVCHGAPSPKVWRDYLDYVEDKYNIKIGSVNFRDKDNVGWHNSTITITNKNDDIIIKEKQNENYYFLLFFNHMILRPSCHECKYSNFNRPADVTLGDYWGIEKFHADFDDDKGTSLVLINSEKGMMIWKELKEKVDFLEIRKEECIQPNLSHPSQPSGSRKIFWEFYEKGGFELAGKRVGIIKSSKLFKIIILLDRVKRKIIRIMNKKD